MDISGEYRLTPKPEVVWQALNDPEVLRRCIPGCEEFQQLQPDQYGARVRMTIGPVKATFDTEIKITNANPPKSYRLEGEGKAAVGFGRGYADVRLAGDGDGTMLKYTADFQIGGRLAQVGSRLVVGATRKIADDFFDRLAADIDSDARRLQPETAPHRLGRHFWVVVSTVAVLVMLLIWWLAGPGTAE